MKITFVFYNINRTTAVWITSEATVSIRIKPYLHNNHFKTFVNIFKYVIMIIIVVVYCLKILD